MFRIGLILVFLGGWPLVASGAALPSVMIVAHRGASQDAPENTLSAFRLAWTQGADAIEGDFFLTKDGQVVCTHDEVTGRLNPGKVKLKVAESTLAELQALDVGAWKGGQWKGERMPTLDDVLGTVPMGKQIFIEVKCGVEILPVLKKKLAACQLRPEQITIISFQKAVVAEAKRLLPEIKSLWLVSFKGNGRIEPPPSTVLKTLAELGADGLDCNNHAILTAGFVDQMHASGYETHCWTVDDPQRAKELAAKGMNSITTNRPALIRAALGKTD